jgi:hypothetical protein
LPGRVRLEQKPAASLGLVDPALKQTGDRHISLVVAEALSRPMSRLFSRSRAGYFTNAGDGCRFSAQFVPQPSSALRQAIRRHFRESAVEVDMRSVWPNVAITLDGVSRDVCGDAVREAWPIAGSVVVRLLRLQTPEDCADQNDMTWWITP